MKQRAPSLDGLTSPFDTVGIPIGEREGGTVWCTSFRLPSGSSTVPEEVADLSLEMLLDFVSEEVTAVQDFVEPHT